MLNVRRPCGSTSHQVSPLASARKKPVARPGWPSLGVDQAKGAVVTTGSTGEELLKKEGVTRIDTLGQPFDPAVMTAIAAESDATRPPQTVLEELAAGYHRHGELLRPAQVKVSRQP